MNRSQKIADLGLYLGFALMGSFALCGLVALGAHYLPYLKYLLNH